jgi:hypothetical protein
MLRNSSKGKAKSSGNELKYAFFFCWSPGGPQFYSENHLWLYFSKTAAGQINAFRISFRVFLIEMYQPSQNSFQGYQSRGRGRGFRGRGGGRGGGRGRGRGGFQHNNNNRSFTHQQADVDYSPEAIEERFAVFYLPSMTQDPWQHLEKQK